MFTVTAREIRLLHDSVTTHILNLADIGDGREDLPGLRKLERNLRRELDAARRPRATAARPKAKAKRPARRR